MCKSIKDSRISFFIEIIFNKTEYNEIIFIYNINYTCIMQHIIYLLRDNMEIFVYYFFDIFNTLIYLTIFNNDKKKERKKKKEEKYEKERKEELKINSYQHHLFKKNYKIRKIFNSLIYF